MAILTNLILSILAAAAFAQQEYRINPANVPLSLREYWCSNQKTQCPLICLQTSAHSSETQQNDCDPQLLTYACVCSNGLSPNLTQYSQTLPFYTCQEWGNECVANCGSDSACASACRQDHPCGAQHPYAGNKSMLTTTMSPGASKTAGGGKQTVVTGFAAQSSGAASSAASSGNGARSLSVPFAMEHGRWLGSAAVVVGGLALGFAVGL